MGRHDGSRCLRLFRATVLLVAGFAGVSTRAPASPLVVTPSAYLSEQYNDNVFFTDQHMDDFITSVGTSLSMQYQRPRFTASLSGGTSAQFYAFNTSESSAAKSQSGTLSAAYQASPLLALTLSDNVSHYGSTRTASVSQTNEAPPPAAEPPVPPTQASVFLFPSGDVFTNYFTTGASYAFYPRWSAAANYSNSVDDFTGAGGHNLTNSASGTLGYAWSPILNLNVSYSYSRLNASQFVDTETHNPSVGMSYRYDPTLSLYGSVGYYVNRPVGGSSDSMGSDSISTSSGATFNLGLSKQFARSSASLGASQGVTPSPGFGGTSLTRTAFLSYVVRLSQHLSGSVGTFYSDYDTNQTNYRGVGAYGSLTFSYPLSRYFSAGASYNINYLFSDQSTSTLSQGSVYQNVVQVFISGSYPLWRGDL